MQYYKFLRSADVDRVLKDSTVLLSSLTYFRDLESEQGRGIGDRLEGATELTTPEHFVATEDSEELRLLNESNIGLGMYREGFAKISGGGKIVMSGTKFVHRLPDCHIFSFSYGDCGALRDVFLEKSNGEYDACLRVKAPGLLREAIGTKGMINGKRLNGSRNCMNAVRYSKVTHGIRDGGVMEPSVFLKDVFFAWQAEHRIVLYLAELPSRVTLHLTDISKYFEQVG